MLIDSLDLPLIIKRRKRIRAYAIARILLVGLIAFAPVIVLTYLWSLVAPFYATGMQQAYKYTDDSWEAIQTHTHQYWGTDSLWFLDMRLKRAYHYPTRNSPVQIHPYNAILPNSEDKLDLGLVISNDKAWAIAGEYILYYDGSAWNEFRHNLPESPVSMTATRGRFVVVDTAGNGTLQDASGGAPIQAISEQANTAPSVAAAGARFWLAQDDGLWLLEENQRIWQPVEIDPELTRDIRFLMNQHPQFLTWQYEGGVVVYNAVLGRPGRYRLSELGFAADERLTTGLIAEDNLWAFASERRVVLWDVRHNRWQRLPGLPTTLPIDQLWMNESPDGVYLAATAATCRTCSPPAMALTLFTIWVFPLIFTLWLLLRILKHQVWRRKMQRALKEIAPELPIATSSWLAEILLFLLLIAVYLFLPTVVPLYTLLGILIFVALLLLLWIIRPLYLPGMNATARAIKRSEIKAQIVLGIGGYLLLTSAVFVLLTVVPLFANYLVFVTALVFMVYLLVVYSPIIIASRAISRGTISDALRHLERIRHHLPQHKPLEGTYPALLIMGGRKEEALLVTSQNLIDWQLSLPYEALVLHGNVLSELKRPEEALKFLSAAIDMAPEKPLGYMTLIDTYQVNDLDPERAMNLLRAAPLKGNSYHYWFAPRSTKLLWQVITVITYARAGNYETANQLLAKLERRIKSVERGYAAMIEYARAQVLEASGSLEEAYKLYERLAAEGVAYYSALASEAMDRLDRRAISEE